MLTLFENIQGQQDSFQDHMLASEVHHFHYFDHILQQTGISPPPPPVQIAAPAPIQHVSLAPTIQYSVPQGQSFP